MKFSPRLAKIEGVTLDDTLKFAEAIALLKILGEAE